MTTKLKRQLSLSITSDEAILLGKLEDKGVSIVSVFRRGLKIYAEDYIDELTQNNNS